MGRSAGVGVGVGVGVEEAAAYVLCVVVGADWLAAAALFSGHLNATAG